MNRHFILSCESTVDLPYSDLAARDIPVIFYSYMAEGREYPDDMGRNPESLPHFYHLLDEGVLPSTSQLNTFQYEVFFEELLQKGDVLHIAFGSGMTGSVRNAMEAAQVLQEKYPDRRLCVADSLCSSSGYGMLVDSAADLRDEGCSLQQVLDWVLNNRKRIHHQFFSTDLKYFRRSGRISGPAAMLGTVLSLCPIMRLDDNGRIIAYDKVRGRRNAIERTVQVMAEHAADGELYAGKCFIAHSNSPENAQLLKKSIQQRFPRISGEIRVCDIGTIIASHCGPGTTAVFFLGDERAPYP